MLDSEAAMITFLNLIASEPDISRVPVMIDSSKWTIIESGLKCLQGKCIVNSISLKAGGRNFLSKPAFYEIWGCRRCDGLRRERPSRYSREKNEICTRSYKLLTEVAGFPPEDIIFDPNIFAVATGIEEHAKYGVDFIEACRFIKANLPHASISGGYPMFPFLSAATMRCARPSMPSSSITRSAPD